MHCLYGLEIIRRSSSHLIHTILNHIQKIRDLSGNTVEAKFSPLTLQKKNIRFYIGLFLLIILTHPALENSFTSYTY